MADAYGVPDKITQIPNNVVNARAGILKELNIDDVRKDIVEALLWRCNYGQEVADFLNSLGLCVEDGKLCVTDEDAIDWSKYSDTSEFMEWLDDLLGQIDGEDVRKDIRNALEFRLAGAQKLTQFINDLGLTVEDGKLCVIFDDGTPPENFENEQLKYYSYPHADVPSEGLSYVGMNTDTQ